MSFELFSKKLKCNAVMKKCNGKSKKLKEGSGIDSARTNVIEFFVDVEITNKIRERLGPRIGSLIKIDGNEDQEIDVPINSVDVTQEITAALKVFSRGSHNDKSEPVFTRGGSPDDNPAKVKLTKIVIRNNCAVMILKIVIAFGHDAWKWCGDCFGDGEFVLELVPVQTELDFAAAEKEGKGKPDAEQGKLALEGDGKDPGERLADKKKAEKEAEKVDEVKGEKKKFGELDTRILELIKGGATTIGAIAPAAEVATNAVDNALRRLKAKKLIQYKDRVWTAISE